MSLNYQLWKWLAIKRVMIFWWWLYREVKNKDLVLKLTSLLFQTLFLAQTIHSLSIKKSNFHYTCGITPQRVTTSGAHHRGICARATQLRRNVSAVVSCWRVGDTGYNLTEQEIKPITSNAYSNVLNRCANRLVLHSLCDSSKWRTTFTLGKTNWTNATSMIFFNKDSMESSYGRGQFRFWDIHAICKFDSCRTLCSYCFDEKLDLPGEMI